MIWGILPQAPLGWMPIKGPSLARRASDAGESRVRRHAHPGLSPRESMAPASENRGRGGRLARGFAMWEHGMRRRVGGGKTRGLAPAAGLCRVGESRDWLPYGERRVALGGAPQGSAAWQRRRGGGRPPRSGGPLSGEEGGDDVAVDVGEAEGAALVGEGEALVVEAEEVEEGGVEVVDVDAVFGDLEADLVRRAE